MIRPSRYLDDALGALPAEPTETTVGDLERLAAIQEGLTRHVLGVRSEIARRTVTVESIDDLAHLARLASDAESADRQLTTYTAAALQAHGITTVRSRGH